MALEQRRECSVESLTSARSKLRNIPRAARDLQMIILQLSFLSAMKFNMQTPRMQILFKSNIVISLFYTSARMKFV